MVDKNKTCECARAVSWDTVLKFSPQPSAMTSPDRLDEERSLYEVHDLGATFRAVANIRIFYHLRTPKNF